MTYIFPFFPITSTYTANWFLRGGKGDVGRMHEDDLGKISGPKENTSGELTHRPD